VLLAMVVAGILGLPNIAISLALCPRQVKYRIWNSNPEKKETSVSSNKHDFFQKLKSGTF
jgi:hypothetical protein